MTLLLNCIKLYNVDGRAKRSNADGGFGAGGARELSQVEPEDYSAGSSGRDQADSCGGGGGLITQEQFSKMTVSQNRRPWSGDITLLNKKELNYFQHDILVIRPDLDRNETFST